MAYEGREVLKFFKCGLSPEMWLDSRAFVPRCESLGLIFSFTALTMMFSMRNKQLQGG